MNKLSAKLVLGFIVVGFVLMFTPAAFAQDHAAADAAATSSGLAKMGGAIGAGLAVIGCGLGIGRVGGSATEAMASEARFRSGHGRGGELSSPGTRRVRRENSDEEP
jgi:hypothetical protein